jgi:uncharacterized protein with PIN domain
VIRGYWLRETDAQCQMAEIVNRFDLARSIRPLSRCMVCNEPLKPASKAIVSALVPYRVLKWCDDFRQCPAATECSGKALMLGGCGAG